MMTDVVAAPVADVAVESPAPTMEAGPDLGSEPSTELAPEPQMDPLKLAQSFSALTKREKALLQREQQLKKQFEEREKSYSEREAQWKEYEETKRYAKEDPLGFLKKHEITYDEITEALLKGGEGSVEYKLKLLEKKMEDKFQAKERERQEAESKAKQEYVDNYKKSIAQFVDENSKDYPLVSINEAHDAVFSAIEAYYNRTGKELSFKEAAEMTESYLEEQLKPKFTQVEKFKSWFAPPAPAEKEVPNEVSPQMPHVERPRTLSNAVHSSVTHPKQISHEFMSRDDMVREAARQLRLSKQGVSK